MKESNLAIHHIYRYFQYVKSPLTVNDAVNSSQTKKAFNVFGNSILYSPPNFHKRNKVIQQCYLMPRMKEISLLALSSVYQHSQPRVRLFGLQIHSYSNHENIRYDSTLRLSGDPFFPGPRCPSSVRIEVSCSFPRSATGYSLVVFIPSFCLKFRSSDTKA